MLIMFLGDSITDWFRDHSDPESLGKGYVKYAAEILKGKYPFLEFRNLGVNGYSTEKVVNLLDDFDDEIKPDIVSIMVGVNDFCDIHKPKDWKPDLEATEKNYETIFREIKEKYVLKMMIHYEKKSDNTVIDAEIGGGRTIISNRIYFTHNDSL
mgnify:CR=1 FL=1